MVVSKEAMANYAAGEPVQVLIPTPSKNQFNLNVHGLARILLDESVKEKHVVVICLVGPYRKGKSFMLDFFLRYMKATYNDDNEEQWLGEYNVPLEGFVWKGGSKVQTLGIHMWSKAFKATLPSGEEVAVVLMDTQGAFDPSTLHEWTTVFALSAMCSSVLIYNISGHIQSSDLMHLQVFTDYGRLAFETCKDKTFQKLLFLVRDWPYPAEFKFGEEGGKAFLAKTFAKGNTVPENKMVGDHIKGGFKELSCFLLTHPGKTVATVPTFDGQLKDINEEFIEQLKELVPLVLASNNLIVKEICGEKVKCKELYRYFISYMKAFSKEETPKPKSIFEATVETSNLLAVAEAKDKYFKLIEDLCGGTRAYVAVSRLEEEHVSMKGKAMAVFDKKSKMGGESYSKPYREKLDADLDKMLISYKVHNKRKSIITKIRIPIIFFLIAVVCYILSWIFSFMKLRQLANSSSLVMAISLLTLVIWSYVNFQQLI